MSPGGWQLSGFGVGLLVISYARGSGMQLNSYSMKPFHSGSSNRYGAFFFSEPVLQV